MEVQSGMVEREVDGVLYQFGKWGAEKSLDVLLDISKVVGKSSLSAIASFMTPDDEGKRGLDKKLDPAMVGLIGDSLFSNMDKALTKQLIKTLCAENCLANGAKVVFNTHYQDKLPHMFKVLKTALEVQYGNFFQDLFAVAGVSVPQGVMNRVSPQ